MHVQHTFKRVCLKLKVIFVLMWWWKRYDMNYKGMGPKIMIPRVTLLRAGGQSYSICFLIIIFSLFISNPNFFFTRT